NYDYMHFRFYASSIGRFLKPDNIIPNVYNPQSWNLYSYVNGNPVSFNDPFGHYCKASNTSQVLFGPGGALGLSPAYGGIGENPQENGTLSGVDAGYYGGAEYSGTERGYWAYTQTYEEQTIEMWLKVNENGYYTLYGESLFAGTQYDWVVYPMRELTVVGHLRWVEVGGGRGGEAIGALQELGRIFLRESLNFGNRWPFWGGTSLITKNSCQDYAYKLKGRLLSSNLRYWNPIVYMRTIEAFGYRVDGHFSVVLEPINGNPFPNVWIDFYTYPQIKVGVHEHRSQWGPFMYWFARLD
ncbi:MAG: RHS repeat domain-containing protein, partial [Fervidobacterium sp.]